MTRENSLTGKHSRITQMSDTPTNEPTNVHSVDPVKVASYFKTQATASNTRMYGLIAHATAAVLSMTPKAIKSLRETLEVKHGMPKGTIDPCFALAKHFAPMVEADVREAADHDGAIRAILVKLCSLKRDVLMSNGTIKRGEDSLSWADLRDVLKPQATSRVVPPAPGPVTTVAPEATEDPARDANTALEIFLYQLPNMTDEQLSTLMDAVAREVVAREVVVQQLAQAA